MQRSGCVDGDTARDRLSFRVLGGGSWLACTRETWELPPPPPLDAVAVAPDSGPLVGFLGSETSSTLPYAATRVSMRRFRDSPRRKRFAARLTVSIVAAVGMGNVVDRGELAAPSPKADGSKPETTSRLFLSLSIGVELEISSRYFSAVCSVHTIGSIGKANCYAKKRPEGK